MAFGVWRLAFGVWRLAALPAFPAFHPEGVPELSPGSCRIAATCYDRYVLKATRARRRVLHSFGEGGSLRRAAWAKFLYALARISLFRFTLTQFVICHLSAVIRFSGLQRAQHRCRSHLAAVCCNYLTGNPARLV